jgi:nodulation protein A
MTSLHIRFVPKNEIDPDLQKEIDVLDNLAFAGESDEDEPELAGISWASGDWMGLGFLGKELATQLSIPKRHISAGDKKVWVAGLGGMATHPKYQHQGLGSELLRATRDFMQAEVKAPFGLLICATNTRPFYERSGWKLVADELYFVQDDHRRVLHTSVMALQLEDQSWPSGEIDLCGSPW